MLLINTAEAKEPNWEYKTDNGVGSIDISGNGEYIVASSDDEFLLFNKKSDTLIWKHSVGDSIHDLKISKNGDIIVVGCSNNNVYVFDRSDEKLIWKFDTGDAVFAVAISADGDYIVAGGKSEKVFFFSINNNTPIWDYSTRNRISALAISDDGNFTSVGDSNPSIGGARGYLYLFDKNFTNHEPLWMNDLSYQVISIEMSSDGTFFVGGGWGGNKGKVWLFNVTKNKMQWSKTFDTQIYSVAISASGERIVAGNLDHKVYLFNNSVNIPIWNYSTGKDVEYVDISADGEIVASGGRDGKIHLFDSNSNQPLWTYATGGNTKTTQIALSADGNYLVAGSGDYKIHLFTSSKEDDGSIINLPSNISPLIIAIVLGTLSLSIFVAIILIKRGKTQPITPSPVNPVSLQQRVPSPFQNTPTQNISSPPLTSISCPGCNGIMKVPQLGRLQRVKCNHCNLEGEIEI